LVKEQRAAGLAMYRNLKAKAPVAAEYPPQRGAETMTKIRHAVSRALNSLFHSSERTAPMIILHLDSSILGAYSASREISAAIVSRLLELHSGSNVTYHDLAAKPPLHLSGAHMAAFQGAPVEDALVGADIGQGGSYIDELFAADIIVIGTPMYNFAIPTQLKGWLDRVIVAGKTFRYGENGIPESLLPAGKTIFIASSRGGFYAEGSPIAAFDFQENYLKAALGFIGLTNITVIRAEGLATGDDAKTASITQAKGEAAAIT
jgi:FMN-dependent NADH-azoreductase